MLLAALGIGGMTDDDFAGLKLRLPNDKQELILKGNVFATPQRWLAIVAVAKDGGCVCVSIGGGG